MGHLAWNYESAALPTELRWHLESPRIIHKSSAKYHTYSQNRVVMNKTCDPEVFSLLQVPCAIIFPALPTERPCHERTKREHKEVVMKSHPYEYKVLVEYVTPEERGQLPHFTHREDQKSLSTIIQDVFEHLPQSIPEGWEVNSHNITVSRNTLIITVLLRKPKSQ